MEGNTFILKEGIWGKSRGRRRKVKERE